MKTAFIFFLFCHFVYGIEKIDGIVYFKDKNGQKISISGAKIVNLKSKSGAFSSSNGSFSLEISPNDTLITSFLGFENDTLVFENILNPLEIELKNDRTTNEITVEESKPSSIINKSSIAKDEIITSKGLTKAACCNLSESFETNPSVDVSFTDAVTGAKEIKLLGLSGSYIQLITEKIPSFKGLGKIFGFNYIPGTWMESIQISKGASTVSTGHESMTGQINIEYKKPSDCEPPLFNIYINHLGRAEFNSDFSLVLNENLHTMFFAHASLFQNEMDLDNNNFMDFPKTQQINLMNRWKYESEDIESMFMIKALNEKRNGGMIENYITPNGDRYEIDIENSRIEGFSKTGTVFNSDNYQSLGLILSGIYHKQDALFGRNNYNATQASFFGTLLYDYDISYDFIKFNAGISQSIDKYEEGLRDTTINRTDIISGLFAELNVEFTEQLTISAGLRSDYYNLSGNQITPRLHFRWQIVEDLILRGSAGSGWRVANIFQETTSVLATSRQIVVQDRLDIEKSWNYGANLSYSFQLFNRNFDFDVEVYRTDFINQVISDFDQSPDMVIFRNSNGEQSFSNYLMTEIRAEIMDRLNLRLSYTYNDVSQILAGVLQIKPYMSRHKGFLNLEYETMLKDWRYDFTVQHNGGGRLADFSSLPEEIRPAAKFPAFNILHAQVTHSFDEFEFYLGVENILDFRQLNPIIAPDMPFSSRFDTSPVWGPLMGRVVYLGIRYDMY